MKYILCLILGLSIISLSQIGEASVPEATAHGEEVHESVLRKFFVKTTEFLEYVNSIGVDEKAEEQKRMEEGCNCGSLGIRG